MNQLLTLFLAIILLASCQKEDLRAPDFALNYTSAIDSERTDLMVGTITNLSSTPANTVSIRIDRYTEFNLVQDPVFIEIDKKLFQGDTAKFKFESSAKIKRVEITVVEVK